MLHWAIVAPVPSRTFECGSLARPLVLVAPCCPSLVGPPAPFRPLRTLDGRLSPPGPACAVPESRRGEGSEPPPTRAELVPRVRVPERETGRSPCGEAAGLGPLHDETGQA